MNKKGFTLIELLAVIVILAIIALIATPIVLNIINETRDSANLRSAEFYLDAVEQGILRSELKNKRVENGEYTITNNGELCLSTKPTECITVEIDGEIPSSGSITIQNGTIMGVSLNMEDKLIIKNDNGELTYNVCTLASDSEKGANEIGAKYECKVDPNKESYTFFVLSYNDKDGKIINEKTKAVTTNLIMDSNIREGGVPVKEGNPTEEQKGLVAWISRTDYISEEIGGLASDFDTTCSDSGAGGNWNKGPITAMNYLSNATKNWTNLTPITISTFNDDVGNIHNIAKTYKVYARMPYKSEIPDYGETTIYLYDYLDEHGKTKNNIVRGIDSYWLNTVYYDSGYDYTGYIYDNKCYSYYVDSFHGFASFTNGDTDFSYDAPSSRGARPVITIKL